MSVANELLLLLKQQLPTELHDTLCAELSNALTAPEQTDSDICLTVFNHLLELVVAHEKLTRQNEEILALHEKDLRLNQSLTIMNEQLEELVAKKSADAQSDSKKMSEQYEELKQTERKIRRSAEIQSVLREIAEATVLSPSMEDLYALIHRVIERVLPAKLFHINLLDETAGEIVVPFRSDYINFIPSRRPVGKGMTEYIMQLGRTVHVTPSEMDRLRDAGEYTLGKIQNVQVRHYLGAPLINPNGKPFGVMSLILMGETQSFQPEDVEAFSIIASQVSMAIERKRKDEERQYLEKQLLHAQKLESLGVLAGGIAHDFNNILMAIIGNADLALMRINKESPAVLNLQRIEQAASRAADLAKQMLAYSGKGQFLIENLDLNLQLKEMLHLLEVSISKKIELSFSFSPTLPSVEADATQIQQIVMNLIINASEAIGDNSGVITITTGSMDCDMRFLKSFWQETNISEGRYVFLEISDTGCGMDKETLDKIFDPFFSTKFTGRGLGMSAVFGIIRAHKGAIQVLSEPEKGTTYKVFFPVSAKSLEVSGDTALQDKCGDEGKVLLVDDEETVRIVGNEMLQALGFDVVTANNGMEALEVFHSVPDIAFVILDLTMSKMDGEHCFQELKKIKPEIKVIISSGFSEQEVSQKFLGKGLSGFIQKPYRLSALKEAINRIL